MGRTIIQARCPKCGGLIDLDAPKKNILGESIVKCYRCGAYAKDPARHDVIVFDYRVGWFGYYMNLVISSLIYAFVGGVLLGGIMDMISGKEISFGSMFYAGGFVFMLSMVICLIKTNSEKKLSLERMKNKDYVQLLIDSDVIHMDEYEKFCKKHNIEKLI